MKTSFPTSYEKEQEMQKADNILADGHGTETCKPSCGPTTS